MFQTKQVQTMTCLTSQSDFSSDTNNPYFLKSSFTAFLTLLAFFPFINPIVSSTSKRTQKPSILHLANGNLSNFVNTLTASLRLKSRFKYWKMAFFRCYPQLQNLNINVIFCLHLPYFKVYSFQIE